MIPAAVVTYHPDSEWPARLDTILREHPRVVVVDNSTCTTAQTFVADTVARRPGTKLHSLPENPGIGVALNLAFSTLSSEDFTHVVAYDQDSIPADGFVSALIATATAHPHAVVIGANWTDPRRPGRPALFLRSGPPLNLGFHRLPADRDLSELLCVITSGSLFDLSAWRKLGGFTEDLFLDLVDTDYCLRVRRAGHDIAACSSARLLHHRGEKKSVRFLSRIFYPAHTPLFRLYCLSRNRVLLLRRHRFRPLAWAAYECAYASKLGLDALFLEKNRVSRLMAIARGTWHGLLNRSGPVRQHTRIP